MAVSSWWFPEWICCYKDECIKFARWVRSWKRSENQKDDQKGFGIPNFLNEGEETDYKFQFIEKVWYCWDLLHSSRNMIAIEEEMLQLNMFKLLMSMHREYSVTLSKEQQMENKDWFDLNDEEVFAFKRKINLWLKNVEKDQRSCTRSERSHSKGSSKKSVKSNMT